MLYTNIHYRHDRTGLCLHKNRSARRFAGRFDSVPHPFNTFLITSSHRLASAALCYLVQMVEETIEIDP